MSLGSRSGVNWMRCQVASIEAAIALARVVLPTPGTSSTNRCPPANRQVSASLTAAGLPVMARSEEHTSELQSHHDLVCRLLLEKKKNKNINNKQQKKKKNKTK